MRIGIMLRHLKTQQGGIGTYSRNIIDALVKNDRGHEFFFIYQDRSLIGSYSRHPSIVEVYMSVKNRFLWDQLAVRAVVKKYMIDIVFNLKSAIPLMAPSKKVCVIHGGDWFTLPHGFPLHDRIYRALIGPFYWKAADAIISISEDATRQIISHLKVEPEKVKTIYYGRDPRFRLINDREWLETVRDKYKLPRRFLLFVGQFYELKNLDRLVQAFLKIQNDIPQSLVLVGKDRWGYLKKKGLKNIDQNEQILLPGWVEHDDMVAIYNLADAYVFPSLYEGFGIPLLEAMACGCPIISSTRGAIPEVVGNAAILIDPLDIDDIKEAISKVALSQELRADLRERGLKQVQKFSWEKCANQTLTVLEDIV